MQNNVELCSFGAFSTQGPTRAQANTTTFTYWFFGRSKQQGAERRVVRCDGPGVRGEFRGVQKPSRRSRLQCHRRLSRRGSAEHRGGCGQVAAGVRMQESPFEWHFF